MQMKVCGSIPAPRLVHVIPPRKGSGSERKGGKKTAGCQGKVLKSRVEGQGKAVGGWSRKGSEKGVELQGKAVSGTAVRPHLVHP